MTTIFLCGDVMTGRGIDQILPHPGDPALRESVVTDARTYVTLAERVNGEIARPVPFAWPWGDALSVLDDLAPDVRLINLETAVTAADDFAPGKAVHYRMNPRNAGCLTAVRPDVCVLANNHVLDFGPGGLAETLRTLSGLGIQYVGAGRDVQEAHRAAVSDAAAGRVLTVAAGLKSSGVPPHWAARKDRPGVAYLPSGRRTVNVVPSADVLATSMTPPCASTICFTMKRPRPVPPPPRKDLALVCLYLPNRLLTSPALIPSPLSVTVMTMASGASPLRTI